jgi:hypothetical protein
VLFGFFFILKMSQPATANPRIPTAAAPIPMPATAPALRAACPELSDAAGDVPVAEAAGLFVEAVLVVNSPDTVTVSIERVEGLVVVLELAADVMPELAVDTGFELAVGDAGDFVVETTVIVAGKV